MEEKIVVTEDMQPEKEWYEQAKHIETVEELSKFINHLLHDYHHDYGTVCKAIGASAVACANLGAHDQCITSFQAGFIMWEFIRHWTKEFNECGLRLIDYDDFLYPQYGDKYDKVISELTWKAIQKKAMELLSKDDGRACQEVKQHWKSIVNGVVPFGYKVKDD